MDLLAPNLNAAKVAYAAQMQREAARSQAKDKKERDRAALEKQRSVLKRHSLLRSLVKFTLKQGRHR